MSAAVPERLTADVAAELVRARLGRDPQDMFEAAVVLEAWSGVDAAHALERGRGMVDATPARQLASASVADHAEPHPGFAAEAVAFVMAILAITWWAQSLGASLGPDVVERALRIALPVTLALQWALGSGYLSRPQGLAALARHRWPLAAGASAVVVVGWVVAGTAGALAAALIITWTSGAVLIRRRWAAAYVVVIAAATAAIALGARADVAVAVTAGLSLIVVLAALATVSEDPATAAGCWPRTLMCAMIGGGLGTMLVVDPSIHWSAGHVAALALLPSTVAGLWSGYHLWGFQHVLVRSLCGRAVGAQGIGVRDSASLRILGGAIARLFLGCVALSGLLWIVLEVAGQEQIAVSVLLALALVALGTLLLSFLSSVSRVAWGLGAVALALGVELVLAIGGPLGHEQADALLIGGAILVAACLPPAVASLTRPEATLATVLWIP